MSLRETAKAVAPKLTAAHLQLLEVCYEFANSSDGLLCGEWIKDACERQGISFHQGWLTKLVNVGLLAKDDSSRGGHRRYYWIGNPGLVLAVLNFDRNAEPAGRPRPRKQR